MGQSLEFLEQTLQVSIKEQCAVRRCKNFFLSRDPRDRRCCFLGSTGWAYVKIEQDLPRPELDGVGF